MWIVLSERDQNALRTTRSTLGGFVSYVAAVGFGLGVGNRLAAERFVERGFDVVGRTRDVGRIGRRFAVDRAFVNDFAFGINHHHIGSVFGAVKFGHIAFRIEKKGGLLRFP